MQRYLATIRHHSIASAREIWIDGSLSAAKARATQEFGDGFLDHELAIYDAADGRAPELVSTRRIGASKWRDR